LLSFTNLIRGDPDKRIADKERLEANENMEKLRRYMMKSKGHTVVLTTGLKDIIPGSEMTGDADEEKEQEALEGFRISVDDDY
jgi:hypothetical protein